MIEKEQLMPGAPPATNSPGERRPRRAAHPSAQDDMGHFVSEVLGSAEWERSV
jgi:hypothetical protein